MSTNTQPIILHHIYLSILYPWNWSHPNKVYDPQNLPNFGEIINRRNFGEILPPELLNFYYILRAHFLILVCIQLD